MKGESLQSKILYPARLTFRFGGEIKSFPDKQISYTANIKGTCLVKKHKRRQKPTKNKPKAINKMVIRSYILIITLNVNGLNAPTNQKT